MQNSNVLGKREIKQLRVNIIQIIKWWLQSRAENNKWKGKLTKNLENELSLHINGFSAQAKEHWINCKS